MYKRGVLVLAGLLLSAFCAINVLAKPEITVKAEETYTLQDSVFYEKPGYIKEVENLTIKGNGYSISGLRMEVLSESIGQDDFDSQNIGFIGKTQGNVIINNLIFDNVEMRINGNIDFGKRLNIGVITAVNNGQILNCKVGNNECKEAREEEI